MCHVYTVMSEKRTSETSSVGTSKELVVPEDSDIKILGSDNQFVSAVSVEITQC